MISLDQLIAAIRAQESGGNYSAGNGSGATGAYQIMPANIGPWTQQVLGRRMTQAEFRANPAAQDAVARYYLGQFYAKYGPEGAAAMWYSGRPDPNSSASSPGAPTVRQYVNQVMGRAGSAPAVRPASDPLFTIPVPGTDGLDVPNPLDIPGAVGGAAAGLIWSQVQPFALTALFAVGGIALVYGGLMLTAQPVRDRANTERSQLASVMTKGAA